MHPWINNQSKEGLKQLITGWLHSIFSTITTLTIISSVSRCNTIRRLQLMQSEGKETTILSAESTHSTSLSTSLWSPYAVLNKASWKPVKRKQPRTLLTFLLPIWPQLSHLLHRHTRRPGVDYFHHSIPPLPTCDSESVACWFSSLGLPSSFWKLTLPDRSCQHLQTSTAVFKGWKLHPK